MQHGLINRVVPLAQLDAAIGKLEESICNKSALAIRMSTELFYHD